MISVKPKHPLYPLYPTVVLGLMLWAITSPNMIEYAGLVVSVIIILRVLHAGLIFLSLGVLKMMREDDINKHDEIVLSYKISLDYEPSYSPYVTMLTTVVGSVALALTGWALPALMFVLTWWLNERTRKIIRTYTEIQMARMIDEAIKKGLLHASFELPPEVKARVDEIKRRKLDE